MLDRGQGPVELAHGERLDRGDAEVVEQALGLPAGRTRIEPLIESAQAEENVFEIARSSRRLAGLIFGSYDYWASLGMGASSYRANHPLISQARGRIVKAAASVGIPAIAEMTTNYPTRDKSDEERRAAMEEFRSDAQLARDFGFAGKWTGIPDQTAMAVEIFQTGKGAARDEVGFDGEEAAFLARFGVGRGLHPRRTLQHSSSPSRTRFIRGAASALS